MTDQSLVSGAWLEAHLDDPTVVIVESASMLPETAAYYVDGHIPGAHYRWWKDLAWDDVDREFPTPQTMAGRLEGLGATDETTIVLVGDTIQFATYVYWVLEMTGLAHLAVVLDGGHQAWASEGRPMTKEDPEPPVRRGAITPGSPDQRSRVGRDDVLTNLGSADRVLLDVRSPEEYAGERVSPTTAVFDHGAERKGRIPGAVHLYYERLLSPDSTFRSADEIRTEFESEGADTDADVVAYCRLSHRATLAWFAATKLAGRTNVRVYDGSWTEWGSIVGVPIER